MSSAKSSDQFERELIAIRCPERQNESNSQDIQFALAKMKYNYLEAHCFLKNENKLFEQIKKGKKIAPAV